MGFFPRSSPSVQDVDAVIHISKILCVEAVLRQQHKVSHRIIYFIFSDLIHSIFVPDPQQFNGLQLYCVSWLVESNCINNYITDHGLTEFLTKRVNELEETASQHWLHRPLPLNSNLLKGHQVCEHTTAICKQIKGESIYTFTTLAQYAFRSQKIITVSINVTFTNHLLICS